ncbi:DUF6777 domain-containing protein [Streptomyces tubercidicus]|uniref:DUF6777 domain-containing protein n=1 Tax=Streptomyces tubercidicus TaxID=47759 RepID=UPI00367FF97C
MGSWPEQGQPEAPTAPGYQQPPPGGPGRGGGGGGGGGGGRGGRGAGAGGPWWKSAPRVAILATAVVVAVILIFVLTRPGGGGSEVFAEPVSSTGPDPVTASSANESTPVPSATPRKPSGGGNSEFSGATPGLYGGTENSASCDVEKQISFLTGAPAKNQAFAGVLGKKPGDVPSYLRSLTPVQLTYDTRVTNHGFKDGKATTFQSVLQSGTAVMVDSYGVPRVRCKCGNPLTPPTALQGDVKTVGSQWPGYQSSNSVVVTPAKSKIKEFTLRDPKTGTWFKRPDGTHGNADRRTSTPPETPSGPASSQPPPGQSPPPGQPSPGTTGQSNGGTGTSPGSSPSQNGGATGSSNGGSTNTSTGGGNNGGSTTGGSTTGGSTTGGNTGGSTTGGNTGGGTTGGNTGGSTTGGTTGGNTGGGSTGGNTGGSTGGNTGGGGTTGGNTGGQSAQGGATGGGSS